MKSIEHKIKDKTAELKSVKEQRASNSARYDSVYASLNKMYDGTDWDFEDYSTLQTSKEYIIKQGVRLHKQEEKLVKKLTRLIKRRKIEPDDELKELLNLN